MKRTAKTLRLRGSRTYGRGRQARTGAGARGGTGNAGSFTHHRAKHLRAARIARKNLRIINLRDLDSRRDRMVRKGLLRKKNGTYYTTNKFEEKYKKILGHGEASFRIRARGAVRISKCARIKSR